MDNTYTNVKVRIKPNTQNKAKWYYGWISSDRDMTGKELTVRDVKPEYQNPYFPDCYAYIGGCFIDKDDCEIIK